MILVSSFVMAAALAQPPVTLWPAPPPPPVAAAPEPPVDEQRLTAARALISVFDMETNVAQQSRVYSELTADIAIAQAEAETGETIPQAVVERIHGAARQDSDTLFALIMPVVEKDVTEAYARHFTTEELQRLKVMMANPLVRRMQELGPDLMRKAVESSISRMVAAWPTQDRMERTIRDWVETLAEPPAASS
jgi:hypothetical protein